MHVNGRHHRKVLEDIARRAMLSRGLLPDFSPKALDELSHIHGAAAPQEETILDMRTILWASIDNDESLDLDQLTAAQEIPGSHVRIFVAIADVDSLVKCDLAIDAHARHNTTSVYTAARIFPMLPEKLSTGFTSLNLEEDRLANIVDMIFNEEGALVESKIYRAVVRNHAKLAYNSVARWLEGSGPVPEAVTAVDGLEDNLRLQDRTAQRIKRYRHIHGALSLETIEARPVFDGDVMSGMEVEERNRAKEIIEDFMIAANGTTARYLTAQHFPTIRRVVRTPKRWERIVEIADGHGTKLPETANARALEAFLTEQRAADPLHFPDLSLSIIKLIGAGEYVAESPGDPPPGHFGLAVQDYTHSTAPNRRYPDLVTQRLVKAALQNAPCPYKMDDLHVLARHFTEKEDDAKKVERQVNKSAAALVLEERIGETFDAVVTGASPKGTWVRLLKMPVEGKLVHGFEGADVGDRLHVELVSVDVEQGFIDFRRSKRTRRNMG